MAAADILERPALVEVKDLMTGVPGTAAAGAAPADNGAVGRLPGGDLVEMPERRWPPLALALNQVAPLPAPAGPRGARSPSHAQVELLLPARQAEVVFLATALARIATSRAVRAAIDSDGGGEVRYGEENPSCAASRAGPSKHVHRRASRASWCSACGRWTRRSAPPPRARPRGSCSILAL